MDKVLGAFKAPFTLLAESLSVFNALIFKAPQESMAELFSPMGE